MNAPQIYLFIKSDAGTWIHQKLTCGRFILHQDFHTDFSNN